MPSTRRARVLKSARVDGAQLRRVRRYLGAKTDSEAIALAVDQVDEQRRLHEFLAEHRGTLTSSDWEQEPGSG